MAELISHLPKLPPRPQDSHKGLFGKVLVIGGSRGMIGAPAMTANAAFRAGAGLVRIAAPTSVQLTIAQLTPCATSTPLPEDADGRIGTAALQHVLQLIPENDALAIGPGLARSNQLQAIVTKLLTTVQLPMVLDADGLNCLAAAARAQNLKLPPFAILTPHPGEFNRLWPAWSRNTPPSSRTDQAQALAQLTGAVIVLKGASTVISDGTNTYVNQTGNPGLATGGTGDILTGVIAALLARRPNPATKPDADPKSRSDKPLQPATNPAAPAHTPIQPAIAGALCPLDAAILGVYVHGLAGDLAAQTLGQTSLMAWDLLDYLPRAFQQFESA